MRAVRVFLSRLRGLAGKARKDRELAEELASHLQMQIEDNLRCGTSATLHGSSAVVRGTLWSPCSRWPWASAPPR
jgi:hypothetical protein